MSFLYEPYFERTECWFKQEFETAVECGYLVVPENRADPNGRLIRIAAAILRNPDRPAKADPIVHLAGGPGEKILHFMAEEYGNFSRFFETGRDVVIFEQRGVGWSEPALDCPQYTEAFLDILDFDIGGRSVTAREAGEYTAEMLLDCVEKLRLEANLTSYNSRESAADVNDLRRVLGVEYLNLHGVSYGSYLALNVMRHYPETVRCAVLDAAKPLDQPLDQFPRYTARKVDAFFDACTADDACRKAFPDLRQVYLDTLKRLEVEPIRLVVTNAVTGEPYEVLLNSTTLAFAVSQLLRRSDRIPALPMIIQAAAQGNHSFVEKFYSFFPLVLTGLSAGMLISVHSREKTPIGSMEAYAAAVEEAGMGSDYWDFHPAGRVDLLVGKELGTEAIEPAELEPVKSDIPTLILGGQFDPNAAEEDMERLAATLANSYKYELPWMGHSVSSNECANRMIRAFIEDPSKAPDSSCVDEWAAQFQFITPDTAYLE
jgi:pimeloyl-ACP methyl ester carboxylesterase